MIHARTDSTVVFCSQYGPLTSGGVRSSRDGGLTWTTRALFRDSLRRVPRGVATADLSKRGANQQRDGRRHGNGRLLRAAEQPEHETAKEARVETCLRRQAGEPTVEMHADDAAPRSICDGQQVRLFNDRKYADCRTEAAKLAREPKAARQIKAVK